MSPRESGPSPETQTEWSKPYDVRDAEIFLPFRTNRLEKSISLVAGTLETRIASQMDSLNPENLPKKGPEYIPMILEDALRQEKTASIGFQEMRSLSQDYTLLSNIQRAKCTEMYERSRQAMESARIAMDNLLADARVEKYVDVDTLAEIRRERPSYDTTPLAV